MPSALDFAKAFMKRELDTEPNTYGGNLKLQKLLFFADFISVAENGKPLFLEPIRAFNNGCVVEEVRLRYKNDYQNLYMESKTAVPNVSEREYEVINLTAELFGKLSATELSKLSHSFSFWNKALERSKQADGFKDKKQAIIPVEDMLTESGRMRDAIATFRANTGERKFEKTLNNVTFYYSSDVSITNEVLKRLELFSRAADEKVYSVYMEGSDLVIL